MLLAAYGSLRIEHFNHKRFHMPLPTKTITLIGYDMYHNGIYPMILPGRGEVIAEVFDISEEKMAGLEVIETQAGYKSITLQEDGRPMTLFVYNDSSIRNNEDFYIPHGDWTRFCQEQGINL